MRKFILILVGVLIHSVVCAQYYRHDPGYVSASVGLAFPFHNFGKNRGTSAVGFAKIGFNTTAEAAFYHSEYVGIGGLYSFSVHGVSEENLATAYVNSNERYQAASVQSEHFKKHLFMLGLTFRVPVNDYVEFNFKLMGGFMYLYKPAVIIDLSLPFTNVTIYESNATKMNFAFYNQVGARFKITKEFHALFEVSYVGSKFEFDYTRSNQDVNELKHIGIFGTNLGVAYIF